MTKKQFKSMVKWFGVYCAVHKEFGKKTDNRKTFK